MNTHCCPPPDLLAQSGAKASPRVEQTFQSVGGLLVREVATHGLKARRQAESLFYTAHKRPSTPPGLLAQSGAKASPRVEQTFQSVGGLLVREVATHGLKARRQAESLFYTAPNRPSPPPDLLAQSGAKASPRVEQTFQSVGGLLVREVVTTHGLESPQTG